jgi:site-specific DNA-methyltransferase (adenine-specific)
MADIEACLSSKSTEWGTPPEMFDTLNKVFHFTLDPAATHENHLCDKYFTIAEDGLKESWGGNNVFCNPPYGRGLDKWVEKCNVETQFCKVIVLPIPVRTDVPYFHTGLLAKCPYICFIKGRVKFLMTGNSKSNSAPFPSMLCVWSEQLSIAQYAALSEFGTVDVRKGSVVYLAKAFNIKK